MARQVQIADAMVEFIENGPQVVYGTSLWRLQDTVDNQPLDQELTDFFAGDIRDVCAIADQTDKVVKSLKDKAKGTDAPGTVVRLAIADVRALVKSACNPKPETPAT